MKVQHVGKVEIKAVPKLESIRGSLLLVLAICYIGYVLTNRIGTFPLVFITISTFIISLPYMSRLPQMLTLGTLGLGHLLFFRYGGDYAYWRDALLQSLPFVALFVSVPLLSIPMRVGGYVDFIFSFMRKFTGRPVLGHTLISGCSFLLGCFMNIGSVRIMNDLFGDSYSHHRERFAKAVMQGFSLSSLFSPYIAGVAIILHLLEVPILSFLKYGILLTVLGLIVTIGLSYLETRKTEVDSHTGFEESADEAKEMTDHKAAKQLIFAFIGLFISIIALDQWLHINLVVIISLIAFLYPFLWVLLIKKHKTVPVQLAHYRRNVLPNVHNESVMLVSASFFAQMVRLSPFPDLLSEWLSTVFRFSGLVAIFSMLLIIIALSVMGIHQILPITIFASTVSIGTIGLDPTFLALVLAIGWGLAALASPISATNIICTQLFHLTWLQLIRENWRFIALTLVLSTIIIHVLNILV